MSDTNSEMKPLVFGTEDFGEEMIVSPKDVGALIGKGAVGAKRCISRTWNMYTKVQSSDKKIEEDNPTLKIVFHPLIDEEGDSEYLNQVWVEIFSDSETMRKLAQLSIKKHITEFLSMRTLSSQSYIIDFPHHLLGRLIGKKATGLNRLLKDTIYEGEATMILREDIVTAQTARLRIEELKFDSCQGLIDYVGKRNNRIFLGWPPRPDDEYTEHIAITVSFKRDADPFIDLSLYLARLTEIITGRVQDIKYQEAEQMDEINECLGFDSD